MVQVPQVQIPNFVGTLGQVEQIQQSRLQALAQRQATEDAAQARRVAGEVLPQLGTLQGPELVGALGRLVGADPRYAAFAAPLIQRERDNAELYAPGGRPAAPALAAPAAPAAPRNPGAPPPEIAAIIQQAARETGVPEAVLTAKLRQESNWGQDPRATTNRGGPAQIISSTARDPGYGLPPISDADRLNPAVAIPWAARYFAARARAAGVTDWNDPAQVDRALAAYNGGGDPNYVQNVRRWMPQGSAAPAAGDTMPTSPAPPGTAPPSRQGSGIERNADGHIVVPGFNMALVSRAYAAPPGNARAQEVIQRYEQGLTRHLQVLGMERRDPTDTFREETRNIGGRQVAGQVNLRTGQFQPYPGQAERQERPEEITPARAVATVRRLGPMIAAGEVAPGSPEFDDYAIAYQLATRPTQVWVDDPANPGTQRQVSQPGLVLDPARFPRPPGEYNAPGGALPASAGGGAASAGGGNVTPAASGGAVTPAAGGDVVPVDPSRSRTDPNTQATAGDRSRLRQVEADAQGILDALQAFRQERGRAGILDRGITAAGIPTPLATAWTNAALLAKGESLFNLGVLNGPDLQIIQRALSDPSTLRGFFTSDAVAERQIAQIENLIRQRVQTARQQFNAPLPPQPARPGGVQADPPAPAPRRAAPQIGTIEDGFRFRGGDPSSPANWERVR